MEKGEETAGGTRHPMYWKGWGDGGALVRCGGLLSQGQGIAPQLPSHCERHSATVVRYAERYTGGGRGLA